MRLHPLAAAEGRWTRWEIRVGFVYVTLEIENPTNLRLSPKKVLLIKKISVESSNFSLPPEEEYVLSPFVDEIKKNNNNRNLYF